MSYSAAGTITVGFFLEQKHRLHKRRQKAEPAVLARGRAIDRSIQFTLWWVPFVVLLGWLSHKPIHMLFGACPGAGCALRLAERRVRWHWQDFFEVALLVGSCFLVNYITADSKTNWGEGLIMMAFYAMIVSRPLCVSPPAR